MQERVKQRTLSMRRQGGMGPRGSWCPVIVAAVTIYLVGKHSKRPAT